MIHDKKSYKSNYEGIYLKFLGCEEAKEALEYFHEKNGIGNNLGEAIAHMILRLGYFWPTIFKDTFEHVHTCHICQTSANKERHPTMQLKPMFEVCPFARWGLDFIGPVNPSLSMRHIFILIATDYSTC